MQPVLARVEVAGGGEGDELGGEPAPEWFDTGEGTASEAPDPGATMPAAEGEPSVPRDHGVTRPRGEVAPRVVDPQADARSAVLDVVGHAARVFGSRAGSDAFDRAGALTRTASLDGGGGVGLAGICGCGEPGTIGHGRGTGTGVLGTIAVGPVHERPDDAERARSEPNLELRGRNGAAGPRVLMCAGPHGERRACVVVPGGLSREVVRRVITQHRNEIEACYEGGLVRRGDLEGVVELTMVIGRDGAVTTSAIGESTVGDRSTEGCVAMAARRWTFPSSDGVTAVRWPYVLSPSGS